MTRAAESFAARVSSERNARGWSYRRLADISGLALSRLHRIESNPEREVTVDDVVALADAFGIPMSWLVQGSHVRSRVLTAARCDEPDSAATALDTVLPVIELAVQLDDLDDAEPVGTGLPEIPRRGVMPQPWGYAAAETVRAAWGIASGPVLDLARVIEENSSVMIAVAPLADGVDGLAVTDPDTGNTLIAVRETTLWERQRFTMAHELGHLVAGDRRIEAVQTAGQSRMETAASEFARNFLVPLDDPRHLSAEQGHEWDEESVAQHAWRYQVSPHVFAIQLVRAGLTQDSIVNRVSRVSADTWSRLGGWEPERRALAAASNTRRVPPMLLRRAHAAFRAGRIPSATLARTLNEDTTTVDRSLLELGVEPALAPR